jgi:hypothetical protein
MVRFLVMPGFDPSIHAFVGVLDGRVKPGHDALHALFSTGR